MSNLTAFVPADNSPLYKDYMHLEALSAATGVNLSSISLCDIEVEHYLESMSLEMADNKGIENIIKTTHVCTYEQLLLAFGLSLSCHAWTGNGELLCRAGHPIEALICSREQLQKNLVTHGMEPDLAYDLSEKIRKGLCSERGAYRNWLKLMKPFLPDWYIESAGKILYLPSHNTCEQFALIYWWELYFRVYFSTKQTL